jgi:AraC family transcriptional regulator
MLASVKSFRFPDIQSTYERTLSYRDDRVAVERIRTSPGYNHSIDQMHCLGIHIGSHVTILHEVNQQHDLRGFEPDDMLFVPAGEAIAYAHPLHVDALYLYFDTAVIAQTAEFVQLARGDVVWQERFGFRNPQLAHLGKTLAEELTQNRLGSALYRDTLILQLHIQILRSIIGDSGKVSRPSRAEPALFPHNLRRALEYIHDHFREDITLAEIAATAYLTPYHFSRVFKQHYGVSPYQYVIQYRLREAARLIQHSPLSISEIALWLGFATPSHLTRSFKRQYGMTPTQFQQEMTR